MIRQSADLIILGAGLGGSLLALLLSRRGRNIAVFDRGQHPRFSIGESSTPLADAELARLSVEFDVPELLPLTRYGLWKQELPDVTCGLKRGFTYFFHKSHEDLTANNIQARQLLVAASSDDEYSDTHWLRSDVDKYLSDCCVQAGATTFFNADYSLSKKSSGWQVCGSCDSGTFDVAAPMIVDATGSAAEVLAHLSISDITPTLTTDTWSLFAHFEGVYQNNHLLQKSGYGTSVHPFNCDAAAVHQVLENGWMWQLGFDDQTVSAGFVFGSNARAHVATPASIWHAELERYPFLKRQFVNASVVRPEGGMVRTKRLQRLRSTAAGLDWAALPSAVGFVDPLHSTGIAHTVHCVGRMARQLATSTTPSLEWSTHYSALMQAEFKMIDLLAAGCYESLPDFDLWIAWSMLYFTAATYSERDGDDETSKGILLAGDSEFRSVVRRARTVMEHHSDDLTDWLRVALQPWNTAGFLDPDVQNLYRHTAAPRRDHAGDAARKT